MCTQRNAIQQAGQCVVSALSQSGAVLTDSGQRRGGVAAEGNIIISHNADILRHPKPQFIAVEHGTVRQNIMGTDNGGTAVFKQTWQMLGQAGIYVIVVTHHAFVGDKSHVTHDGCKGIVTLQIDVCLQSAAQIADFAVTLLTEMIDRQTDAFYIIDADAGHLGVAADTVVVEHRGGFAGFKLPNPRV